MIYILIPTADMVDGMINRSNSRTVEDLPVVTHEEVEKNIIEIPKSEIVVTTIFDEYKWYSKKQIKEELNL